MIKNFVLIAAGVAMLTLSGAAVAGDQNTAPQVQQLADRIRSTISALPASSTVAAYQAQISSTLEDGYTCEVVREALARPYTAPSEAQKALGRLRTMFSHCNFGTGAVSRGAGYGNWGVGFSVGGGSSNYRP